MTGAAGFDVVVLGSAGTHTGPGRACSSYLVRAEGYHLLVDCGNGSTANLQTLLDFHEVDAVVISHRHADHVVDIVGMYYALKYGPDGPRSVSLYAAAGVHDTIAGLVGATRDAPLDEVLVHTEVRPGDHLELGPFDLDFHRSVHPVPTVSTRIGHRGRTLVYSADSAGGSDLVDCARDADLLLCEATWPGDAADWPPGVHLTASAAADVATRAGVDRLVLTHVLPTLDRDRHLEEAASVFDGDVSLADDLATWRVG